MKRSSIAIWDGSLKEGSGNITSASGALDNQLYTWNSRFAEGKGTNPEELIAAAHAGCFTMKLTALLEKDGFIPEKIETTAEVTLEKDAVSHSHLVVKADVPGISEQRFEEHANDARNNCPVSKALNMAITMDATLNEKETVSKN